MAEATTITTLRHARTYYGAEQRYAGSLDVPLSEQGEADCRAVSPRLADQDFDVVISSPLQRAARTAELVLPGTPTEYAPLTVERNYGAMEGKTYAEVRAMTPPILFIEVGGDTHSVNPPGGEPFEDVWRRAQEFHRTVLERHAGQHILVVSHSAFLQMLHGSLSGLSCIESLDAGLSNLELTTFRLDGATAASRESVQLLAPSRSNF